jgi:hypothetical protein
VEGAEIYRRPAALFGENWQPRKYTYEWIETFKTASTGADAGLGHAYDELLRGKQLSRRGKQPSASFLPL